MNLPNKLTILRIIMIPIFITLFFVEFPWHRVVAMVVFCAASVTDFLDGFIARKQGLVTHLGKFLDPIADKMLVACALVAVCVTPPVVGALDGEITQNVFYILVAVFAMIILSRELMISGFRTVAADKGMVLAADMIGKVKTVSQMLAIILLLPVVEYYAVDPPAAEIVYYVGFALLAAATLLTIVSAVNYLIKNRKVLEG
ncbi:MAG: CDP-diacylglycerol--glycerol-3-phosphate 3-phosphatidyltransferase [Clostridiales bacterium]|nr:CDP-diacylglycerol--glycerol-3-phosphate 3-phosphatidyltransferase [Clostridiales bacterium]